MFPEELEQWINSLQYTRQLFVFKALSEYLSVNELKNVMTEVGKGRDLLAVHSQFGLIIKYQVDLIRIHNSMTVN